MASNVSFAANVGGRAAEQPAAAIAARLRLEAATTSNFSPHSFSSLRFAHDGQEHEPRVSTLPAREPSPPGTASTPAPSSDASRPSPDRSGRKSTPGQYGTAVLSPGAPSAPAQVRYNQGPRATTVRRQMDASGGVEASADTQWNTEPDTHGSDRVKTHSQVTESEENAYVLQAQDMEQKVQTDQVH